MRQIQLARLYTNALAFLFLGFMFAGLVTTGRRASNKAGTENRQLAQLPPLPGTLVQWQQYPTRFEQYFDDNFGLRRFLIRINTQISFGVLGRSPSERVLLGQRDWLFYAGENAAKLYQNRLPLSQAVLDQWRDVLTARMAWLASQNIGYVYIIPPDKHTIYPERMPKNLRRSDVPSQYDQLLNLARQNNWPMPDLRIPLLQAKQKRQLYFRDDTHWNDRGAYEGYIATLEALGPSLRRPAIALGEEAFLDVQLGPGDLASMAMMSRQEMASSLNQAKLPCQYEIVETRRVGNEDTLVRTRCSKAQGKLLLFRDSFSNALLPLLAQNFGEVAAYWTRPSLEEFKTMAEDEKPDFVVEERVERFLGILPR